MILVLLHRTFLYGQSTESFYSSTLSCPVGIASNDRGVYYISEENGDSPAYPTVFIQ